MVPKLRTSLVGRRPAVPRMTQATTEPWCTSSPAARSISASIATPEVAGAAPRDGRQRLAHVLTGRAGRDLRWSLNAARTDLLCGVGCHLPITGLHASATRHVGEVTRRSTPAHFPLEAV